MNKTKSLFSIVLMTIISALFVSCGDDDNASSGVTLSGSWRTDIDCPSYIVNYNGYDTKVEADYRQITFTPGNKFNPSGIGKMVDFYPYGPTKKIYRSFIWELDKSDPSNTITKITFMDNADVMYLYRTQISAYSFGCYYKKDLKDGVLFEPDNTIDWNVFDFEEGKRIETRENWEIPFEEWLTREPQQHPVNNDENK